ncbi:GNAT family N-acetyltransferase, partial [Pseudonocardia nigra]|uniref:GNAT family N-acetyltransferase n=1 Tax=Pseudonocardia nigra TaxID=1921578 RepID=UPI001C5FE08E
MHAPVLPSQLHSRPMRADDAARWAELLAAAEEVDRRGENYDAQDCADELADPEVDLERNSCIVLDGERPVAYQVLHLREGVEGRRLFAEGTVHPAHRRRGIGSALLAVARRRAEELSATLTVRVAES